MKNLNEYETPETDAETAHKNDAYEFVNPPEWEWVVTSEFARDLERRLAMCRDALDYIANHSEIYRTHRGVAIETLKATEPK